MTGRHPDERLVPYLLGELAGEEARAVKAHLQGCLACRQTGAAFARLAADLRTADPPPVRWGAYRAELREKLDRRGRGRSPRGAARWVWPSVPAALAAGLVAVLLFAGLPGGGRRAPDPLEPVGVDHPVLASRLDLISRLDLFQRLDLLEDLDVIGGLDRLPLRGEG